MMLGARIVVEQSSLVNETHLLTPKFVVCSSRLGIAWGREHPFRIKLGRGKFLRPFWGREAKRVGTRWPKCKAALGKSNKSGVLAVYTVRWIGPSVLPLLQKGKNVDRHPLLITRPGSTTAANITRCSRGLHARACGHDGFHLCTHRLATLMSSPYDLGGGCPKALYQQAARPATPRHATARR